MRFKPESTTRSKNNSRRRRRLVNGPVASDSQRVSRGAAARGLTDRAIASGGWKSREIFWVEARHFFALLHRCLMWRGSSVSGFYYAHPESRYFGVGKIERSGRGLCAPERVDNQVVRTLALAAARLQSAGGARGVSPH